MAELGRETGTDWTFLTSSTDGTPEETPRNHRGRSKTKTETTKSTSLSLSLETGGEHPRNGVPRFVCRERQNSKKIYESPVCVEENRTTPKKERLHPVQGSPRPILVLCPTAPGTGTARREGDYRTCLITCARERNPRRPPLPTPPETSHLLRRNGGGTSS